MMKWISVRDRLPEVLEKSKDRHRIFSESSPVLITTGENRMYVAMLVGWSDYKPEEWDWDIEIDGIRSRCCGSRLDKDNPVTHWMPLPKGPENNTHFSGCQVIARIRNNCWNCKGMFDVGICDRGDDCDRKAYLKPKYKCATGCEYKDGNEQSC